eukprot:gene4812-biopygen4730
MTWQYGLPLVCTIAAMPCLVTDKKLCGCFAARTASTAMPTSPPVPFLNPTGIDSPDASSRWICDSVVLAPIAPHDTKSAKNCGVIVSKNSHPHGKPSWLTCCRNSRAVRRPLLMLKVPLRSGSLMSPFQPMVVLGFSKYTRMTMIKSFSYSCASFRSAAAYSSPAFVSWMLHGPTTTTSLSSRSFIAFDTAIRPLTTVFSASFVSGTSSNRILGGSNGFSALILKSSMLCSSSRATFESCLVVILFCLILRIQCFF